MTSQITFYTREKGDAEGERQSVPGPGPEPDPLTSQCPFSLVDPLVLWGLRCPGLEPVSSKPALD